MKPISPNQDNVTILIGLCYETDEFAKVFQPVFARHLLGERRWRPFCRLSVCEIMTILIAYQIIGGQNPKVSAKTLFGTVPSEGIPLSISESDIRHIVLWLVL